jgi:AraC-like DNA-binding protein
MIRVGMPVLQHASTISVAAPRDILTCAAYHMGGAGQDPAASLTFQTDFVGTDNTPVRCGDSVWLTPQHVIGNGVSYDVILVPALIDNIAKSLEVNGAFLPSATYVQHMRIEAAKQCLERSAATVGEITCQVGYSDMRSFRRLFQRCVGLSPKDYRAKFQEMAKYAR